MGKIRVVLVGVSKYFIIGLSQLPFCMNDLQAMKTALINGLNVYEKDIVMCGETGIVTLDLLVKSINNLLSVANSDDTFIFYFSGHGGKNCLLLSNEKISLQDLIDTIEKFPTKNKIIILDSCHSGGFSVNGVPQIDIEADIEKFAGYGYAVMASCGASQKSGFDHSKKISLYTRFVCDALTSRFLIKHGKKSLEEINEAIFHFASISNRSGKYNVQEPIFRSNLGGTIFFNVEEYTPYRTAHVYEETDKYIIYKVEPLHNLQHKRLAVKIILRYAFTLEEIAKITPEIISKVMYCDVFKSKNTESRYIGKASNVIWCYYGYDEDDMIRGNFICRTTWIDDSQDEKRWYRSTKNSQIIAGVYFDQINGSYNMIKQLKDDNISKEDFICITRRYTLKLISLAEQCIKLYREFLNNTLSEEQLINDMTPLNNEISKWYFKQSNLPIPQTDLHEWADAHEKISGTIHDFSLFYNKKHLDVWPSDNRKWQMANVIKRYEKELEELKSIDKQV